MQNRVSKYYIVGMYIGINFVTKKVISILFALALVSCTPSSNQPTSESSASDSVELKKQEVEPQGRVPVPRPAKQRNNLSASPLVSGTVKLFYMSNFQKTVRIMENPTLPTNWLAAAKHLMVSLGGMAGRLYP